MECEDIINKKFNRSFIGYDIGQVDAFLDELYSEMQALKAELEMLRAARQMNSDSKPKHGPEENSKTADEQSIDARCRTDSKTPKTKQSQHQNGCSHPFFSFAFPMHTAVPKK